jgi:hypothetical protein
MTFVTYFSVLLLQLLLDISFLGDYTFFCIFSIELKNLWFSAILKIISIWVLGTFFFMYFCDRFRDRFRFRGRFRSNWNKSCGLFIDQICLYVLPFQYVELAFWVFLCLLVSCNIVNRKSTCGYKTNFCGIIVQNRHEMLKFYDIAYIIMFYVWKVCNIKWY